MFCLFTISANPIKPKPNMQTLIDAYSKHLYKICFFYLKNLQSAEDAVQETLIKAYLNYHKLKDIQNERAWISKIAQNICKDQLKNKAYKEIICDDIIETVFQYKSDEFQLNQESIELLTEVYNLPFIYKQAVLLFYYEDYTLKEIEKITGVNQNTIAKRLERAKATIKSKLTV